VKIQILHVNLYASIRVGRGGTEIVRLDPDTGAVLRLFATIASPLNFNTGMLFIDQACSSLKSVEGGASRCFAPKPLP